MTITQYAEKDSISEEEEVVEEKEISKECKELLLSLPREKGWRTPYLYLYQNFWCQAKEIQAIVSFQKHFQPKNTDVILATIPKSGTTWLKALAFATINRQQFSPSDTNHPLLTSNPHDLVPFFEYKLYANNQIPDLSKVPSPRLFGTHIPLGAIPESVKTSGTRIVYLCRNPFDTFISVWHFLISMRPETLGPFSLEEGFDMYCKGVLGFGPFWAHMLRYWKESSARPEKVLFLKYEDLKEDAVSQVKILAEFLGFPFTVEEERDGVVEEICGLCSFEKQKDLKVNKEGKSILNFENRTLFRKGVVGDWVNHLSPLMVERLTKIVEEKIGGSGLEFKVL